ncbi:MAG: GWxTD domain-containing protein, partial [Saprospiraceae bacterium]
VKRYPLPAGDYEMSIQVVDASAPDNKKTYRTPLTIGYPDAKVVISDVQLLASIVPSTGEASTLSKQGYDMEPLPFNFYQQDRDKLFAYAEIYGMEAGEGGNKFVVASIIEKMSGEKATPVSRRVKAYERAEIVPVLTVFPISKLGGGNYRLVTEVRSATNELIERRETGFQRSNPAVDGRELTERLTAAANAGDSFADSLQFDTLRYSLLALLPLLPQSDIEPVGQMIATENTPALRLYLADFWRKETPANPGYGYGEFMEVARAVDEMFQSGFRNGFETDRGVTFIKYGRPNDIVRVETDPDAPPYEVWSYDFVELTGQSNRRFIFYNPTLAADDFELLHSDVRGERANPQWQLRLYRNSPGDHPDDFIQGTEVSDQLGRRSRDIITDY